MSPIPSPLEHPTPRATRNNPDDVKARAADIRQHVPLNVEALLAFTDHELLAMLVDAMLTSLAELQALNDTVNDMHQKLTETVQEEGGEG